MQAAFAFNEDGAGERGEPAEDGPAADIGLGNKHGGGKRAKDKNVHIAEMIAHEQTGAGDLAGDFGGEAEDF